MERETLKEKILRAEILQQETIEFVKNHQFEKGKICANQIIDLLEPLIPHFNESTHTDKQSLDYLCIDLIAFTYNKLAIIEMDQGDFNQAIELATKSIQYCKLIQDDLRECSLHNTIGNAYRSLSEYEKALEQYNLVFEIAKKFGFNNHIGNSYTGIGSVYMQLNQYHVALEYYIKALEIYKSVDFLAGLAALYMNIGNIYSYLNEADSAMSFYNLSIEHYNKLQDKVGVAISYANIAILFKLKEDFDAAIENSLKAIELYKEIGMSYNLSIEYCNLGDNYYWKHNFLKAKENFHLALELCKKSNDTSTLIDINEKLGSFYANMVNPEFNEDMAEKYLLESIDLNNKLQTKKFAPYKIISELYKKQNRWKESLLYFEHFYQLENEVKNEAAIKQTQALDNNRKIEEAERDRQVKLARFKEQEKILLNILPAQIAERILEGEKRIADLHEHVSVFFSDIVGFTKLSQSITPDELLTMLNEIFSEFDRIARKHGLEKIKTIGDAYMAVAGVPIAQEDHAARAAGFAFDVLEFMKDYRKKSNSDLQIRVGLHCGKAIAGVIGENKFAYDLWGDSVNTASRMESHGEAGRIHVSEDFRNALSKSNLHFMERGEMEVKGKGKMKTYFLETKN